MIKSEETDAKTAQTLYPELEPEERTEAMRHFKQYLTVVKDIFESFESRKQEG